MRDQVQTKAVVSVTQMARMLGLSRARFYQLMQAGTFPLPVYDTKTRRPLFLEEVQLVCLEVRRRNCGIDGKPVLFYARGPRPVTKPRETTKTKSNNRVELIDGLAALGLTSTSDQIEAALKVLYPSGTENMDGSTVLRAIFLHLKRQNTGDNVGR